jgi:hypothetical protein
MVWRSAIYLEIFSCISSNFSSVTFLNFSTCSFFLSILSNSNFKSPSPALSSYSVSYSLTAESLSFLLKVLENMAFSNLVYDIFSSRLLLASLALYILCSLLFFAFSRSSSSSSVWEMLSSGVVLDTEESDIEFCFCFLALCVVLNLGNLLF